MSEPTITLSCPDCGQPLVIRTNRENGSRFLGCSQYPECKHTEPLPPYFTMLEAGAKPLPGF